jgi:hypothetical protein
MMLSQGALGLTRLLCLTNITLMEETLSETIFRRIHCLIIIFSGIAVCLAQILSGDILTGTAYNMLTRQGVPPGMVSPIFYY